MSRKGLILRFNASEEDIFYFLAPWMVGIWEFQVNNLTKENIKLYERFYEEGIVRNNQNKNVAGFRVIPIEKEIEGNQAIQPFEKISEIIDSQTRFAVAECICRKEAKMIGEGCDKLLESCMSFGVAADYYIENGFAREITKEEAKEILIKTEEDGLVHFSSNHAADKIFICNCCGCCCKALANITKYNNTGVIASSNYYAVVNQESCDGCETCIDRCQVDAIKLEDEIAQVEIDKCIGCGLCVSTCPSESIAMNLKPSDGLSKIYTDDNELIQAAAKDANKIYPFE
jgi:NAD-dependent dihydropyrimidine dehydrogenase PreA subunit